MYCWDLLCSFCDVYSDQERVKHAQWGWARRVTPSHLEYRKCAPFYTNHVASGVVSLSSSTIFSRTKHKELRTSLQTQKGESGDSSHAGHLTEQRWIKRCLNTGRGNREENKLRGWGSTKQPPPFSSEPSFCKNGFWFHHHHPHTHTTHTDFSTHLVVTCTRSHTRNARRSSDIIICFL